MAAIRQVSHGEEGIRRRDPVIAEGHAEKPGAVVQVQLKKWRCRSDGDVVPAGER
jgi:hypothetical protein